MHKQPCPIQRLSVVAIFCALILTITFPHHAAAQQKLTPEEIVAKHLDSIGSADVRAKLKTMLTVGVVNVTTRTNRSGAGSLDGQVVIASEDTKQLLGMSFPSPDYPLEKFGYDGKDLTVGYIRAGARSRFGEFILNNSSVFKQGLVTGVLSTSWAIANIQRNGAKLQSAGTEKIDGRTAYKIRFLPKNGSDMNITLYFDAENFRHLRSEYTRVVAARQSVSPDASINQREGRYTMMEDFSDFRKVGDMTLPNTYKLRITQDNQNITYTYEWLMKLSRFSVNQELPAGSFNVNATS